MQRARERREAAAAAVIRSRRTAECELTKLPPSFQSAAATINAANAYPHSPPSLSNMETIENSSASEGAR